MFKGHLVTNFSSEDSIRTFIQTPIGVTYHYLLHTNTRTNQTEKENKLEIEMEEQARKSRVNRHNTNARTYINKKERNRKTLIHHTTEKSREEIGESEERWTNEFTTFRCKQNETKTYKKI